MLTDHCKAFDIVLQDNEETKQILMNTYYLLFPCHIKYVVEHL